MNKPIEITEKTGWFSQSGNMNDVVISSRFRLSRNINGYRYPGKMDRDEEAAVSSKIIGAFEGVGSNDSFGVSEIGEIDPIDRRILLERNHITQDYMLHMNKNIVVSGDNLSSCVINDMDHLRFAVFDGGLEVRKCAKKADQIDSALESALDYAVSFEFGYLNTEVNNLGTGARASVMMHLPALVETNLIEKALKAVVQIGFTVKGFMGDEDHSLGSMYQISNQFTIGQTEEEIVDKLENLAIQIAGYELKAREEMFEKKRTAVEDSVFRAYGLLTNCRLLGANEAIDNLSTLRMGIALGLIDLPIEVCTSLIFLSQKSHIQKMINDTESGADETLVDFTRAAYVKDIITKKS
ncbi:MAG: hypothetical protein PQJ61_12055 [Spirochaetales bacterium]|uniref:Phosphagen kinase C-terminal domain-containing protein n=1 Tax=Candidatus Thalassospirochaeta sargassi TaxID=3119039 RepID=A0AAJ1IDT4_9SPIO|nr:hypothetical protein [Spirochaetales bacterium]